MDLGDDAPEPRPRSYKPGNTGPDGDYLVGKNRPPKATQFAVGDGRKRGRRPKGQRNFDTEFTEEANRGTVMRENGKKRRVSKLRSTIVRAFDNAAGKGQNEAIKLIFAHSARIADKVAPSSGTLGEPEDALVEEWVARRLTLPSGDPLEDPEPDPRDLPGFPDEESADDD